MNSTLLAAFHVEKHEGDYKDFGLAPDDPYPLRGVTYPCDYGYVEGYIGEDGADLDFFVGATGDKCGYIRVARPELPEGEHKFYVKLTNDQVEKVQDAFKPVLIEHGSFQSEAELLRAVERFRKG